MTIEKWFFLLVTGFVLYLFWTIIEPFAFVLLFAAVIAIILSPVDRLLKRWVKNQRLSAILLTIGTFALVFIPVLTILLLMAAQASELIQTSLTDGQWLDQLYASANPIFSALPAVVQEQILAIDIGGIGKTVASWSFDNIGNVFSSTTKFLINTFLFFISLYYLLVERENLYKEALALSPLRDSIDSKILKRIVKTIRSVVFGVLLLAIIQGIIAGIGMTIFGVPGALIWGALTIIAALVPFVGTALVLVPAILYLFFTGSVGASVGLLIWSVVFVSMADNFIGPYLIKGTTHMHAFLVLLSVLGGLATFGAMGVMAGPTILAAMLALLELYKSGILTTGKIQD